VREPRDPVVVRERYKADRREKAMSYKTRMNDSGESYSGIVPAKQPNESLGGPQEAVEGRPLAKGNTEETNSRRTQRRGSEPPGLDRVREAAKKDKGMKFTALLHHVNGERLRSSYQSLKKEAAVGVDGTTWEEYGEDLEAKLSDLQGRIHRGAYQARPTRRVWIPKDDGRQRPIGITALEDKIAQHAVGTVLSQIWEEDFLGFSYGFRPGRSQHDALDALTVGIMRQKVNWILDLDIKSFFDRIEHEWMIRFVEHRVGDQRIVRLIQKWLKAGVMEDGRWFEAKEGTPQGAVISPLLANLYLHYVLDVWTKAWREKIAGGEMIIVRYADDAVLGFQYQKDAERFLRELEERLRKFGLELHPDKTRLIEFGRYAAERRANRGEGKPETFNFLGFTHICGRSRKTGYFTVYRKTIGKRMAAKLRDINTKLQRRRHAPTRDTGKWLASVVRGYFQYHAVPENEKRLRAFRKDVQRLWLQQLRRRSQKHRWTWKRFRARLEAVLPFAEIILHPWPNERFDAKHPRQEPCALVAPARVCPGGGG
jgi:group II intron reverse transcriptase/maturase